MWAVGQVSKLFLGDRVPVSLLEVLCGFNWEHTAMGLDIFHEDMFLAFGVDKEP